jgi:hypothetical protein
MTFFAKTKKGVVCDFQTARQRERSSPRPHGSRV